MIIRARDEAARINISVIDKKRAFSLKPIFHELKANPADKV